MEHVYVTFPFKFAHGADGMAAIIRAWLAAGIRAAAHHGITRLPVVITENVANVVGRMGDKLSTRVH